MKTMILFAAGLLISSPLRARERMVMIAPFDNLSGINEYINYEVDAGVTPGNPRKQFRADRYSHAPREMLEGIILNVPGLQPVERTKFDQVMLEVSGAIHDGLTDPEKAQQVAIRLGADGIIAGPFI